MGGGGKCGGVLFGGGIPCGGLGDISLRFGRFGGKGGKAAGGGGA